MSAPITVPSRKDRSSPFGVLKGFLAHSSFENYMSKRLMWGRSTPHIYLSPQEKQEVARIIVKMFAKDKKAADIVKLPWPKLLLLAINHERFRKAWLARYNQDDLKQIQSNLSAIAEQHILNIEGEIEAFTGNIVRGWAVDADNVDHSLELEFLINGQYAGHSTASGYRPELEERFGGHGNYAFEHHLSLTRAMRSAGDLELEIFDRKTGTPIITPRMIRIDRSLFTSSLYQLSTSLEDLKDLLAATDQTSPDYKNLLNAMMAKLDHLENMVPTIHQLGALPVGDYADYAAYYRREASDETPMDGPKFFILSDARDTSSLWQSLSKQTYKNWNTITNANDASPSSWILSLNDHDELEPDALAQIATCIMQHENAELVITDYDHHDAGTRWGPVYHAGFDYDLTLASNPLSRAIAIKGTYLAEQNQDEYFSLRLALKVIEHSGEQAIHHIPEQLFHIAKPRPSELDMPHTPANSQAWVDLVSAHIQHQSQNAAVVPHYDPLANALTDHLRIDWTPQNKTEKIAIIIPTRDGLDMMKPCVESLLATADEPKALDIIIVDNQSSDPETLNWFQEVTDAGHARTVPYDAPFNWSAANDVGVNATDAEYLLFLNNDTVSLEKGWDTQVRGYLSRKDVGAVGARLLYEDDTIQHAGVVLMDPGVAAHEGVGDGCADGLYRERTRLPHRCSAVTGAFLAVRRDTYDQVGGFDAEKLTVTFNDVDFGLKVDSQGLKVLYTPQITFRHLESKSRGFDRLNEEKLERARREQRVMEQRWDERLKNDPWYPSVFTRNGKPFSMLKLPLPQQKQSVTNDAPSSKTV